MPRRDGRRDRPVGPLEDGEHVALQRLAVSRTSNASAQLLRHDPTEVLERGKAAMKLLERFIGGTVAKGVDEQLGVENVLASGASHRSGSGGVISIPCIARVPSISSRWNTTRSSARSMASVTVAAPSARFAAPNLDSGSRYVLGTRCSRCD